MASIHLAGGRAGGIDLGDDPDAARMVKVLVLDGPDAGRIVRVLRFSLRPIKRT